MHITIVIPTYWGRKKNEPRQPGDGVFDHPTPIDDESLLGRCLESFKIISGPAFDVLIITAVTNPTLAKAAEARVEQVIAPFRDTFNIGQFGPGALALLRERLEHLGFDPDMMGLDNYGRIRNCQLIGPHLLGSDVIIGIDDDEIITDPDYVNKAVKYLGQPVEGKRVDGVAGIYVDRYGDTRLLEKPDARDTDNPFKGKDAVQNDGHAQIEAQPGELVETSVALGGNQVFSRALFEAVSFDPWITRGEDIDYLINSRMHGFNWFLHKELFIVHMPPDSPEQGSHSKPSYSKLQQDVVRFLYTQAKLAATHERPHLTPVTAEELNIYPGQFLQSGLESHALEALTDLRPDDVDTRIYPEPREMLEEAVRYASESAAKYFDFAEVWPRVMTALADDKVMRDHVKKALDA